MASETLDINSCYETFKSQALERNDKSTTAWIKYKDNLEVTKSLVTLICKKMKHSVLVPIGTKALMSGKIVHTNEYLINLGETWFIKGTAHQTLEICDRRVKNCDDMLEKLKKERELIINKSTLPTEQEAFGSDERPEIIEYVSEQENEEWKKQHRIKEKKYRQQLAELRKTQKNPIETEEDLWKHLDELELQEELEDELNRLRAEYSSEEDISDENSETNLLSSPPNVNLDVREEKVDPEVEIAEVKNLKKKKKVTFACDLTSSDDEPLLLEIKHSKIESVPIDPDCKQINSPADIYHHYLKLINDKPLSDSKNKINQSNQNNFISVEYDNEDEGDDNEEVNTVSCVFVKNVSERCNSDLSNTQKLVNPKNKKISKFKLSRGKNLV